HRPASDETRFPPSPHSLLPCSQSAHLRPGHGPAPAPVWYSRTGSHSPDAQIRTDPYLPLSYLHLKKLCSSHRSCRRFLPGSILLLFLFLPKRCDHCTLIFSKKKAFEPKTGNSS